jgi:hypothetical protein
MATSHDISEPYKAANVAYALNVLHRTVYLGKPLAQLNDNQIINVEWFLHMLSYFGAYDYSQNMKNPYEVVNKQYVDYCCDNLSEGVTILYRYKISGDTWNGTFPSYASVDISRNCIASISFNYTKIGPNYASPIRIYLYNPETKESLHLFGKGDGSHGVRYNLIEGHNKIDSVILNKDYRLIFLTEGLQPGSGGNNTTEDFYGILENIQVKAKLKTTETALITPITINTPLYYSNQTKEFPIKVTGTYKYSFFCHNGQYNQGNYYTDLIKFSLINQNGTETILFNARVGDSVFSKVGSENNISGSIAVSSGSKFKAQCSIGSEGGVGIIELLTIKGTI